jgi:hypothetical protein
MSDEELLNLLRAASPPAVLEDKDFQPPPKDEDKQDQRP